MPRYTDDSNDLIYQIASQAILDAMDEGANTPEDIHRSINEWAGGCEGVAGYSPDEIIKAYWEAGAFLKETSGTIDGNVEFRWPATRGTFHELLCISAVNYIAQVAKELYEQEYSRSESEMSPSDYPIR